MPQNVQIHCINKTIRQDPHERIQYVGGINPDRTRWKMSQPDAIRAVKNGTYQFFVSVGGNSVWVVIAQHNGHDYLRTQSDGVQPDNLLSLPECP